MRQHLVQRARGFWAKEYDQLPPERVQFLENTLKWNKKDFAWYGKCEKFQRQLVMLHSREKLTGPMTFATLATMQRLDPLFDPYPMPKDEKPLRFVGESGAFEPGKIAAAEKAKLPADAIEVVEQLLIWMPDDLRLFWLLGELLNAKGDVVSAQSVFKEIFSKYMQTDQEFQRLSTLKDPKVREPLLKERARELTEQFTKEFPEVGNRYLALINFKEPPPAVAPPPAGAKEPNTPPASPETKPDDTVVAPLNVDLRALGVGLGAGGLAGFLFAWWVRDMMRRRSSEAAP